MPLSKDIQGGGTNADSSQTREYCSRCYQQGKFIEPNLTVEEMTLKVKGKLKALHIPGFLVNFFTKDIPRLKRWRIE